MIVGRPARPRRRRGARVVTRSAVSLTFGRALSTATPSRQRAGTRGRSRHRRRRRRCAPKAPAPPARRPGPVALLMPVGRIITAPLLKMICSSRPSSLDHLQRDRLVRLPGGDHRAADRKRRDPAALPALRRTRPAASAPDRAPSAMPACRAARRSRRRSVEEVEPGKHRLRSGSSRPVTRISLRPVSFSRRARPASRRRRTPSSAIVSS